MHAGPEQNLRSTVYFVYLPQKRHLERFFMWLDTVGLFWYHDSVRPPTTRQLFSRSGAHNSFVLKRPPLPRTLKPTAGRRGASCLLPAAAVQARERLLRQRVRSAHKHPWGKFRAGKCVSIAPHPFTMPDPLLKHIGKCCSAALPQAPVVRGRRPSRQFFHF